jgi:hypothetical protein
MSFQEKGQGLYNQQDSLFSNRWLLPLNLPVCQQQKQRFNILIMLS